MNISAVSTLNLNKHLLLFFFFWPSTSEIQTTDKTNLFLKVMSLPQSYEVTILLHKQTANLPLLWAQVPALLHPAAGFPSSIWHGLQSWEAKEGTGSGFKLLLCTQDHLRVLTHLLWPGLQIQMRASGLLRAWWFPSNCHKPSLLCS